MTDAPDEVQRRAAEGAARRCAPGRPPRLRLRTRTRESAALIRTFDGHDRAVNACAFSPDGRTIVSASWDTTLRLWDAESGREIAGIETPYSLSCAAAHPARPRLAYGDTAGSVSLLELSFLDRHDVEEGGGAEDAAPSTPSYLLPRFPRRKLQLFQMNPRRLPRRPSLPSTARPRARGPGRCASLGSGRTGPTGSSSRPWRRVRPCRNYTVGVAHCGIDGDGDLALLYEVPALYDGILDHLVSQLTDLLPGVVLAEQ